MEEDYMFSNDKLSSEPVSDSASVKRPLVVQDNIPKLVDFIETHTHVQIHFLLSTNLWSIDLPESVFYGLFARIFGMANALMPRDSDLYLFGENIPHKQQDLLPPFCRESHRQYIRIIVHAKIYSDNDMIYFQNIESATHPYARAWKNEMQKLDIQIQKWHGTLQTVNSSNLEYTWELFFPVW